MSKKNWKMKCIDNGVNSNYTIGKIYTVINNTFTDDTNFEFDIACAKNFKEWCNFSSSKWELVLTKKELRKQVMKLIKNQKRLIKRIEKLEER